MCVPTLAVCTLATLAAPDLNQPPVDPANVAPPSPETILDRPSPSKQSTWSDSTVAIAPPESFATPADLNEDRATADAVPQETIARSPATASSSTGDEGDRLLAQQPVPIPVQSPPPSPPSQTSPVSPRVQIQDQALPVPGSLPLQFTFPIRTEIVVDSAVTTNNPITDQEFPNPLPRPNVGSIEQLARYQESRTAAIQTWAEQVRECMLEKPWLVTIKPDGTRTRILFNGERGRIVRNANGRLTCPIS